MLGGALKSLYIEASGPPRFLPRRFSWRPSEEIGSGRRSRAQRDPSVPPAHRGGRPRQSRAIIFLIDEQFNIGESPLNALPIIPFFSTRREDRAGLDQ